MRTNAINVLYLDFAKIHQQFSELVAQLPTNDTESGPVQLVSDPSGPSSSSSSSSSNVTQTSELIVTQLAETACLSLREREQYSDNIVATESDSNFFHDQLKKPSLCAISWTRQLLVGLEDHYRMLLTHFFRTSLYPSLDYQ